MKKMIIAIVGASGSGKTTMGLYLCKSLGYRWICSYTTRSMRDGEEDGVDHWFVSEDEMPDRDDMMAYTLFGGSHYWTVFGQFADDVPNVYVVDEKGLLEMCGNPSNSFDVLKVYVRRSGADVGEERMGRDADRTLLPDDYYDIVIDNDGNLEEFLSDSVVKIHNIVNLK